MAKSLAAEVKTQVQAILKARYPESYKQFKLKCKSWSTGGSVDIFWTDGPSENTVKQLFVHLNAEHIISIGTERGKLRIRVKFYHKAICYIAERGDAHRRHSFRWERVDG